MTVQTNTTIATGIGNGVTSEFPITFKFNRAEDLIVYLVDEETEAETPLTLYSDYIIDGAGTENGGTLTMLAGPLPIGQSVVAQRVVDLRQLTDLRNQGRFFAEVHEDVFDKLVMIDQQQQTQLDRSMVIDLLWRWNALGRRIINVGDPIADKDATHKRYVDQGDSASRQYADERDAHWIARSLRTPDPVSPLPGPESRAGRLLSFDAHGRPVVVAPQPQSATELAMQLADPDKGAAMVARGVVAVDSIADLLALPEWQRRTDLRYLVKGYHAGSDIGGGEFTWDGRDMSAQCAADPLMGIYVPPDASTGEGGAYVRKRGGARAHPEWFGGKSDQGLTDNYLPIMAALNHPDIPMVVLSENGVTYIHDEIPSEGYFCSQPLVVPAGKEIWMDSPIIYTGSQFPAVQIGGTSNVARDKPHKRKYKLWVIRDKFSDWSNQDEVGLRVFRLDYCTLDIHHVLGFRVATQLWANNGSSTYNRVFWGELRGCQVGTEWIAEGSGWLNEWEHYGGRIACTPVPAGMESSNRYGVIQKNINDSVWPVENHVWIKPCFEIGSSATNTLSVPVSTDYARDLTFLSARTEGHKGWVAMWGARTDNCYLESTIGRNDPSVPAAFMSRDPIIALDNSTNKSNVALPLWLSVLMKNAVQAIDLSPEVYASGGGCGVIGCGFVTSTSATPVRSTTVASRVLGGGVLLNSGNTKMVVRIALNGARRLLLRIKGDNVNTPELLVRPYDASMNLLISSTEGFVKDALWGNQGWAYGTAYEQRYSLGPFINGCKTISVTNPDVKFLDILIGGVGFLCKGFQVLSPDGAPSPVRLFPAPASPVRPTTVAGMDTGMRVVREGYDGVAPSGWIFNGAEWVAD